MARLEYSVIDDFNALMELYPAWERAFETEAPGHPLTASPEWFYGCWFQYSGGRAARARAIAVWSGCKLVAVFPFLERRAGPLPRLEALSEIVPVFCCVDDADVYGFLWSRLARLYGDFHLELRQVELSRAGVARSIAQAERVLWRVDRHKTHDNVIVDLRAGWAGNSAHLSRNSREAIRKATTRLRREAGGYEVRSYRSPAEITAGIDRLLCIDALSWKRGMGGAMCEGDGEDVLYKCMLERLAAKDRARVFTLEIGQWPAAFMITLRSGPSAYCSIWTHADRFSYYMPGRVLMNHALHSLATEGVEQVDFWGRWDRFKASWSRVTIPRHRVHVRHHRSTAARTAVHFADAVHGHPVAGRLRHFFCGDPERHRAKAFIPSPLEQHLVLPVQAWLTALRVRAECRKYALREQDRAAAGSISVRALEPGDKSRWGLNLARTAPRTLVCEKAGRQIGLARLHPLGSGTHALVELFVVTSDSAGDARECAHAILRGFERLSYLYEEPAREARRGELSMIDALALPPEPEAPEPC